MNNTTFSSIVSKISAKYEQLLGAVDIAIDLGTATTRIGIVDKGVVLKEPTFIGLNTKTNEYIFFGTEAKQIYGKTPHFIKIIKPVENSILADFDACVALIDAFTKKAVFPYYTHNRFIRTGLNAYISIPSSATEVQQKATVEAVRRVGYASASLIQKPFLAATGAGFNIFGNTPIFTVDIGAGSVEIAVIIMGGIVASKTLSIGGDYLDRQIANYIHLKYGIITGELTVETLKSTLLNYETQDGSSTIRGKSLENGLPKSVKVTSNDIKEATSPAINQLVDGIKEVIESLPPEIVDGVFRTGAVLTGGVAECPGLDHFISSEVKVPMVASKNAGEATMQGLLILAKQKALLPRILV